VKNEWPNGNSKLSHLFTVPIWPFIFHYLLKWLNLLFPFGHSFFTTCSSNPIYCSHLAIHFSPLAQVTQFTVPIWPFLFHYLLKWHNLLFHLAIHFLPVAPVTQFTVPFGHSFFTISKLSHLSKWWKMNGQMGTVNWVTWANSEKRMVKWEQ
jgi:hypothetical protein